MSPRITRTAHVRLREDGIVEVRIQPKVRQGLTDAQENLGAALELAGDRRRPLFVDIRQSEMLEAAARHYYGSHPLQNFTALAMLLHASPVGLMMGNVYLKIAKHRVPFRLFRDEQAAIAWLSQYRI